MIWHPGSPGDKDIELEPIGTRLNALAVLPGRLVGGGDDGCIWVWDLDRRSGKLGRCPWFLMADVTRRTQRTPSQRWH